MRKLGFVIPWYDENIPGGAEMLIRGLTTNLHKRGVEIEILTTCVKEFSADWSVNYYNEGEGNVHGFPIRRFPVRKRDTRAFDEVNLKLINGEKISLSEEEIFMKEMVNSPKLYEYISRSKDDYEYFIFIPYMFGTTYYGIKAAPEKAVIIPCFHDEAYLYLSIFKEIFEGVRAIIYNARPEMELANKVFDLSNTKQAVIGTGLDTNLSYDSRRFREKYDISDPYIIYAGRKDQGKNVHVLIKYYEEFLRRNNTDLRLILIGGGTIDIPKHLTDGKRVIDLGYIDIQDKYDAMSGAVCLCQPSNNESFSLVIMESFLCGRPVIVSENCAVTKNFAIESRGGLFFKNYLDFEGILKYYVSRPEMAESMGRLGCEFVKSNFDWDIIVNRTMDLLSKL